jgi:hypothetical protein
VSVKLMNARARGAERGRAFASRSFGADFTNSE